MRKQRNSSVALNNKNRIDCIYVFGLPLQFFDIVQNNAAKNSAEQTFRFLTYQSSKVSIKREGFWKEVLSHMPGDRIKQIL